MTDFRGIDARTRSIFQLIELLHKVFSVLRRLADDRNSTLASRGERFQGDQVKICRSGVCAMKRHTVIFNFQPIN